MIFWHFSTLILCQVMHSNHRLSNKEKKFLWFLLLTQRILKSQEKSLNVAEFKPIITLPCFCCELCCPGKSLLFLPSKKKLMTNSAKFKKWCLFSKPLIIKEPIRDEKNGESFLGENTNHFAFLNIRVLHKSWIFSHIFLIKYF